ncbi:hypothetical protein [Planobispora longispora]|uniref:Uncharacterized protein n=1 Tax=Planobispora longispora TaxID=28887 RepID=A0A8J3RN56_9ACTN|nr:hypothetical protein [Planobispora longispora]GIH76659.1 hypothetical protein Plo01_30880 [Planobispora longispora]
MTRGEELARSTRRRGGRRRRKARNRAMEVSVGAAAAAVIGLAVGGTLFRADPVTSATAVGPGAPEGPAATGGPLLSGEPAKQKAPAAPSGGTAPTGGAGGPDASADSGKRESGSGKDDKKKRGQADREARAEGPSRHTDAEAVSFFRRSEAAGRVKDIRTVGGYLRIYTDLPESADNSRQALELCETGREYLEERGVADPVVFVQAEFGENGNPVLANVLGPGDSSCRVTHPEPGG